MTPSELKSARHALGLSAQGFADVFGIASGRTVRGWEAGQRSGQPVEVPGPVVKLVKLALDLRAVRKRLRINHPLDAASKSA